MYEEKEKKGKTKRNPNRILPNPQKKEKKNIKIPQINFFKSNEFLNQIEWKKLGLKLLALLIVVFLFILTTSRLGKHEEKESQEWKNNIDKITVATLKYYAKNPLPINIGDSTSLLLEEMVNMSLLDEVKEKENGCNYHSSYVILTKKTDTEYRLKIYLECPKKKNIVEKNMICNSVNCEIKNKE